MPMFQLTLDFLQNAVTFIDGLQMSATGLIAIAALFFLVFLFALREAAAWFFKVDDVKRDIRRLRDATSQLEGEVRALQSLIVEAKERPRSETPTQVTLSPEPGSGKADLPSEKPPTNFPIVH